MPRIAKKMFIAAGLLVLAICLALATQVDDWSRDLTTNRAATSENASDPRLHSLQIPVAAQEVEATIKQFVDRSAAWSFHPAEANIQQEPQEIHLVRTSRLFRFADDIHIFLQSTATGTRVDAASQSRVGNGDLGQNPRNLHELLHALRTEFNLSQPTL